MSQVIPARDHGQPPPGVPAAVDPDLDDVFLDITGRPIDEKVLTP
jgi:hypothetical protein